MDIFTTCPSCMRFLGKQHVIHYWLDNKDSNTEHFILRCPYCNKDIERVFTEIPTKES